MFFFNQDMYEKLVAVIKQQAASGNEDAMEDLGFLKKSVLAFANYVYVVNEEQIETRLAEGIKKGNELREIRAHFDSLRHNAHEAAIVNAGMINRIASVYEIDRIFTGDLNNRREVGQFCGEITNYIFLNRYN